jgi:hypothetical protein
MKNLPSIILISNQQNYESLPVFNNNNINLKTLSVLKYNIFYHHPLLLLKIALFLKDLKLLLNFLALKNQISPSSQITTHSPLITTPSPYHNET